MDQDMAYVHACCMCKCVSACELFMYLFKMTLLTSPKSWGNPLPSKGLWGLPAKWKINNTDGLSIGIGKWLKQPYCHSAVFVMQFVGHSFHGLPFSEGWGRQTATETERQRQEKRGKKTKPSENQTGNTFLTCSTGTVRQKLSRHNHSFPPPPDHQPVNWTIVVFSSLNTLQNLTFAKEARLHKLDFLNTTVQKVMYLFSPPSRSLWPLGSDQI